jgi:hypothetical protein
MVTDVFCSAALQAGEGPPRQKQKMLKSERTNPLGPLESTKVKKKRTQTSPNEPITNPILGDYPLDTDGLLS